MMPSPEPVRPWEELRTSGLLWLINACVLHPRGYAMAFSYDGVSPDPVGWKLIGDGGEVWEFANGDTDAQFAAIKALLP